MSGSRVGRSSVLSAMTSSQTIASAPPIAISSMSGGRNSLLA
jgi:hypothetical protein